MAINIIINAGVSIFAVGMLSIMFMPTMYDLAYTQAYWNTAPTDQLIIRDNIYSIFITLPAFLIGAIILWAYKAVTRQENLSS